MNRSWLDFGDAVVIGGRSAENCRPRGCSREADNRSCSLRVAAPKPSAGLRIIGKMAAAC